MELIYEPCLFERPHLTSLFMTVTNSNQIRAIWVITC